MTDIIKSMKVNLTSNSGSVSSAESIDRLSPLLERFRVRASLFHTGLLCGRTVFDAQPDRAFLHVLRRGTLEIEHPATAGLRQHIAVDQPTLLLYPRAVQHAFINPPREGSDFTCATLHFDGGDRNPIVAALPPLLSVPLDDVVGLRPALDLLFAETDRLRCGSHALADRMFEVVLIQLLRWVIDHPQAVGVSRGLVMGLTDPRLARALVALHRAPDEDWPLTRMAAQAGMSRSAFAEAFRSAMGLTPSAYLTDWRLTVATSLLRAGQPQKQVAADLGFSTASSLSRAFKQRFGVSPREWLNLETAVDRFGPASMQVSRKKKVRSATATPSRLAD